MSEVILEISNLRKKYKEVVAVDSLSLTVKRGQVFGLLGPNGSGKTTTLAILLGVLNPTSGSYSWFGNGDHPANRLRIGALLETPNFYPYLNAVENLQVVARIKHMHEPDNAIRAVLERVDLWERRESPFRAYSLGMKQRLAIASALLNDPDVLVLDEPTNGLDPMGIADMRRLIQEIAKEGKTIIIASHILDEVEKICTHVAIMRFGKLLQIGEIADIMSQERRYALKADDMQALQNVLTGMPEIHAVKTHEDELLISVSDAFRASELNKQLVEKHIYLSGIREYRKNLETTFLEIVEA